MLSGMLLHVVTASGGIDLSANACAGRHVFEGHLEIVDDAAIFGVGNLGDAGSLIGPWR